MSRRACVVPKIDHQRWSNPFTATGLRLPPAGAAEAYQLHEAGCMVLDGGWRHEGVCSPFWRLFYDFTPGAWVASGGRRFALGPDLVAVMPDGVPFDCGTRAGVEHLWVHFSLYRLLPEAAPAVVVRPAGPAVRVVAADLRARLAAQETLAARHLGAALLHLAFADDAAARPSAVPERLRRVVQRIEAGLGGAMSNRLLAGQAGMSVEAFIRWFRGQTGRTPAAFVAERRIREACRRLALTDQSIEQVAEAAGFANRHHFSRVFKRFAGCGPAEFRRGRGGI